MYTGTLVSVPEICAWNQQNTHEESQKFCKSRSHAGNNLVYYVRMGSNHQRTG